MSRFLNDINVTKQITTSILELNGSSTGKTLVVASTGLTTPNTITLPNTSGTVSLTSHTHNYAGSSSVGGSATSANKVNNSLALKFDTGTTEGTSLYTFDGSKAKTLDIKGGTNVSLSKESGVITINSSYVNTTYTGGTGLTLSGTTFSVDYGTTAGTAAQGNDARLSDTRTPKSHTHGLITNEGKIGTTANLILTTGTGGSIEVMAAGTNSQYMRGDGSWATPPDTLYTADGGIKLIGTKFEHENSVSAGSVGDTGSNRTIAYGGSFILPKFSYDKEGHITTSGTVSITMPPTPPNTTYSVGNGLTSSGTVFSLGTPSELTATTSNNSSTSSHTHSINTGVAVALSNTSTSTTGTSVSLARADHTHKITGFSLDTHNHSSLYQPLDADLTSIAGLTNTFGFLKKTANNTWSIDTTNYLSLTGGTLTGTLNTRSVLPTANNSYDIGSSALQYKNAYLKGEINAEGGGNIGGTLTVNDLTVNGTSFIVNSTITTIDDPVITIGGDTPPLTNDGKDKGIEYRWHNGSTAKIGFIGHDLSTGEFTFIPDAVNTNEVFTGAVGVIRADLNGNAKTVTNGVYTTGSYSDPSWLNISKTKIGLSNVENTKLSTWAGTTNITKLGTIGTGTWNASTIAVNKGGTGTTSHTANKVLTGNGTSAIKSSTNLHWDDTNNRLGVNTATPAEAVHTRGNVRIDDSAGNTGFVMAYDNVSKALQFNFAG